MSIIIKNGIACAGELEQEGIQVLSQPEALKQDIRSLEIAILNLMPAKQKTERQLFRLLGQDIIQVNPTLLRIKEPGRTLKSYLRKNYQTFEQIASREFDGLIITGAPVEQKPFEEVDYWKELCEIIDWSQENVYSTLGICWGAQALANYLYGVEKRFTTTPLGEKAKMFGIFRHTKTPEGMKSSLLRGIDDEFDVPVARHTGMRQEDLIKSGIDILAYSEEAGVYLAESSNPGNLLIFNHPEYEATCLKLEYERDLRKDQSTNLPQNYFSGDPEERIIRPNTWRANGMKLYSNWLKRLYDQSVSGV